jgi:hypothetical protein
MPLDCPFQSTVAVVPRRVCWQNNSQGNTAARVADLAKSILNGRRIIARTLKFA